MKFLGALFATLLFAFAAQAQLVITPQPPLNCPYLGTTAAGAWVCSPAPAGGGGIVTAGPGITVTGCPSCVVSASFPAFTKTASYTIAAADAAKTFIYNSASPGVFTLPATTTAGFGNGWAACFINRGTGALTFVTVAPSTFYGGPTTLNHSQSTCIEVDDTGSWAIFTGVSPVVANPNPF